MLFNPFAGGCTLLDASDPGSFTSPNHPDNYPLNVDECWLIENGDSSEFTMLSMFAFDTELDYDFVVVSIFAL